VHLTVLWKNRIAFPMAFVIPLAMPLLMWILFIHTDHAGFIKLCESEDLFTIAQLARGLRSHSSSCVLWAVLQPDVSGKVKLSLVLNWAPRRTDLRGSGSIARDIPNLGTRWRWVMSFTPKPFVSEERTRYPLDVKLDGRQSRSGRCI
jgi:hypothetical protein